ncbi:PASTA domain-containing protein [Streptomyces sp. SUK 48]|uniref:PASTA domain-containing protein n=1 Tax=Streptomyces sp. SUK 48 TaxID=2582831 RepID=UPI00129B9BC4|nr:PASTA domain-containing protein [Streptomyces sp. SUK 48]
MRNRVISAVLLCAAVGLTACQPTDSASDGSNSGTKPGGSASKGGTSAGAAPKTVRNFVGMGLQSAQDAAQADGFFSLTSHDALGRDRMQALDRNWKVCSQNVAAGRSVSSRTTLDFGAVKLAETCPGTDQKEPTVQGGKMPDFKGKSVKAVRAALDSGTSITVKDASADGRWILVESNWQVCAQTPAAGSALRGQPVTLTAVKFGESCP